ncbi:SDR family oxidoreductase, partial [Frankia sp. AgKG'84/4]
AAPDGEDTRWARHAAGHVSAIPDEPIPPVADRSMLLWPPSGARRVDLTSFHAELAEHGYDLGPSFMGLRAMWRRADEVFAEVALTTQQRARAARFGLHPVLLDAALRSGLRHAVLADRAGGRRYWQPAEWSGMTLHEPGAQMLRVRLSPADDGDGLSLEATDENGQPVLRLAALRFAPVTGEQLAAATGRQRDALFAVEWSELPPATTVGSLPPVVPLFAADEVAVLVEVLADPVIAVFEAPGEVAAGSQDDPLRPANEVLAVVQAWLDDPRLEPSTLLILTRTAVVAVADDIPVESAAAVWGLVRAAQAENPDRITLLDLEPGIHVESVLGAVLAAGEPQLAARGPGLLAPRLVRAAVTGDGRGGFRADGTVLVTGGTGSLGVLVVRHLVTEHGVRHLVLASRRGPEAEGARELAAELVELGAEVTITAADVAERGQVAALLAGIDAEHPLSAVVHTAGVLDDGLVGALTSERMAGVFGPKGGGARHLDELTRDLDLDAFVVFSSAAGLF